MNIMFINIIIMFINVIKPDTQDITKASNINGNDNDNSSNMY